jgi:hypothetical protein
MTDVEPTAREQLARLMSEHRITAEGFVAVGGGNRRRRLVPGEDIADTPVTADAEGWQHRAFTFDVTIGGEAVWSRKPYRTGTGIHRAPDGVDLFAALLTDASMAAPYEGVPFDEAWIASADDLGAWEADAIAHARTRKARVGGLSSGLAAYIHRQRDSFRECRAAHELLVERLGRKVTASLMEAAQEL